MCIPKRQHGKQAVQHKRSLLPVCFAVCVPFVCCLCDTSAVCFPFVYIFTPHEQYMEGRQMAQEDAGDARERHFICSRRGKHVFLLSLIN